MPLHRLIKLFVPLPAAHPAGLDRYSGEGMDGKSILPYFHNRIAAEIRLPEAIDRKLLCPFQYLALPIRRIWMRLKTVAGGYQKSELEHIYTFSGALSQPPCRPCGVTHCCSSDGH